MPTSPQNTGTYEGMIEVAMRGAQGSPEASKAVEAQEADGQRSFTTSDTLPTMMGLGDRVALEQAGVVFGEKVDGDEIFTYVTLPAGWKKVASPAGDSRWTELHDDKDRCRASIFYKAAFYDRSANLNVTRRFNTGMDYDLSGKGVIVKFITDRGTKVFITEERPYKHQQYGSDYNLQASLASQEVADWLAERYPNWEDASAYWD